MTTLAQLRDKTQLALADAAGATWPDATVEDWLIDAIREFPILRPRQSAQKSSAGVHAYDLPADFSEVISVEYPLDQEPKAYLLRFSHYRQEFWAHDGYFDIERDFHAGKDFELWISNNLASDEDIYVNYMARHDTELVGTSTITVPDRYLNILVLFAVWRAFQERLAAQTKSPTEFNQILGQLSGQVREAEEAYRRALAQALSVQSTLSRTAPQKADRYDRIY